MSEQNNSEFRQKIQQLITESLQQNQAAAWFEVLYNQAQGNAEQIPWAKMTPNPILQDWIDQFNPSGEGKTALVIGCGLGDDAEALSDLGYQVSAFDISPTAIDWCRQRFPNSSVNYLVADLLNLDAAWNGKFNLVFESRTIQSLPLDLREKVIKTIAKLVSVEGILLVIAGFRETETPPSGPPWPLSESELSLFQALGLKEINRTSFTVPGSEALNQLRLEYCL